MENDIRVSRRFTRRAVVKGAAGTAAVGAVALGSAGIGAAASSHSNSTTAASGSGGAKPKTADSVPPADAAAGQFVVHVRDVQAGTLDVYSGTRHMVVTDHDIASRLAYYTW